ncbi:MAG: arginine--tRNA ligase [Flavobacteriales bacterium CG_4_10_14_0_2_um_filter_32_8]|nr:MAG: arginine--tRNA ligase [Flavobacteriales bacterium CG_4_10_14_0_2_um_filter_32_8]PJB15761.1 MAG: arginine--tRNA ligase [Flavobacteriales bacterium CG_4_9_14_3_um_filter_32_8]
MEKLLIDKVVEGIKHLYGVKIDEKLVQVQKTRQEFAGDLTVVVFPFLKISKKSPELTAGDIGNFIKENIEEIVGYNVVKGFLNFSITSTYWLNVFNTISKTTNYGFAKPNSGNTIMVEYSSPNTNKPLHLGHLRNNFLGYAVAEILKALGHQVVKTQIINDRGIHICKSMLAWQKFGKGETPENSGLKGDHLVGKYYVEFDKAYKEEIKTLVEKGVDKELAEKEASIFVKAQEMLRKWEDGDEEVRTLWKKMNSWVYDGFAVTYQTMGVNFDELYYESDTYLLGKDVVAEGLAKKIFYQKEDNSVWCDLSSEKIDDKLLLRSDGTSVYMTQDVGTAIERYKKHPDLSGMIYTVGNEQNHHFKVLFAILKKLGYQWADGCFHLSYGMIELPEGKMKSREGTVVDADDLMEMMVNDAKEMTQNRGQIEGMTNEEKEALYATIGLGSLKYFLLKVDPKKGMVFNPAESIDLNGNTGPFIQYAHARIQSLLRKAAELGFSKKYQAVEMNEKELELIKLMNDYPVIIKEAGANYSPALIANYIFNLVKEFNNFYQTVPILKEEDLEKLAFRICLSETIGKIIKSTMSLLGVKVPDKM